MDRDLVRAWLLAHSPVDEVEERCVDRTLGALGDGSNWSSRREFTPGHVTASALVVCPEQRRILLVSHRAFGFWMQPGGHLDPEDIDPRAAALRELREEAGLSDVEVPVWAPALLDVEVHDVPARLKKDEPAHNHFDLRFAFRARTLEVSAATDAKDAAWFDLEGLDEVNTDASVRRAAGRLLARMRAE